MAEIRMVSKLEVLATWEDGMLHSWRLVRQTMGDESWLMVEMWVSQFGWSTVRSITDDRKGC